MARTYTTAEREHALDLYADQGPAAASRATGIPSPTIRTWAARSGAKQFRDESARANVESARLTWEQRRAELTVRLGEVAALLLEKAAAAEEAQEAKNFMLATAIGLDKAELLSGRATVREESVSALDREIKALLLEIEHAGEAQEPAAETPAPEPEPPSSDHGEPEPEQDAPPPEAAQALVSPSPPPVPPPSSPPPPAENAAVPWARRWG